MDVGTQDKVPYLNLEASTIVFDSSPKDTTTTNRRAAKDDEVYLLILILIRPGA